MTAARGAVFLDRDGTIIRDANYIGDPEKVRLIPGAGRAIARLNAAGIPAVVVTNQSGIARGMFSEADYAAVKARMEELLASEGARIDATFMCPHHPDFTGPCDCRKPGTLLFRQAADALRIDLTRSWYVGDKLRDVEPARALGGHGVLVPAEGTPASDVAAAQRDYAIARSLDEAVSRVVESAR